MRNLIPALVLGFLILSAFPATASVYTAIPLSPDTRTTFNSYDGPGNNDWGNSGNDTESFFGGTGDNQFNDGIKFPPEATVPEPSTILLLGLGLAGAHLIRRRRA